ncbi:MAG: DUF2163 domain-containing protein [Devosia sp.]|uniref:DUF2163 domain-containing protein n=1 Tax=Devosia sp. TaxID=1871048 RepID=UPI0024C87959|nr:DUF2163 domain-containing protein [Devosia sp.]UYN99706.1 MAG: DUF2163 domain-containing protein [Devosia sp.]
MKSVPSGLAAHLAQGETTLARCWRIVREDGAILGFTDHDRPLTVSGTICAPTAGFDAAEVPSRLGAQVETGEVLGILDSASIAESDIAQGRYDGARVESWLVNWRTPSQAMLLRVDTIGAIVREDGLFRAELRSPQQALNVTRGRHYHGLCDADLGDARCGINLNQSQYRGTAIVGAILDPYRLELSGIGGFAAGWFSLGHAVWTSGGRNGLRDAVVGHERAGGTDIVVFEQRVGEWVAEGDALLVHAGCDRRFSTCRERFDNGVNFRGFPHIPGSDFVLRHPRPGDALDGRAVVP